MSECMQPPSQPIAIKKMKMRMVLVNGKQFLYAGGDVYFESISDAGWILITSIGNENLYFSFKTDSGEQLAGWSKCL